MAQQNTERKGRKITKPYLKWSHDEKLKLIRTRIRYDQMFTSKNANISNGWKRVAEVMNHPGKDFKACRQQWKNLLQKYKSYLKHRTEEGASDDAEIHEENWAFFNLIHGYASRKNNFHPLFLMDSTRGAYSMELSPPNLDDHSNTSSEFIISLPVSPPPIPFPSSFHPLTLHEQYMSPPPIPATSNFDPLTQSNSPPTIPSNSNFRPRTPFVPVTSPPPVISTPRLRTLTPSPNSRSSSSPSASSSAPISSHSLRLLPDSYKKMSEYEKHCVKRDNKISRQIDGMMSIFAQMVSREYPDIDVKNLLLISSSEDDI